MCKDLLDFICSALEAENHTSHSEDECTVTPDLEEIGKRNVKQLKSWLEDHRLKRSGSKEVLIERVYRAFQNVVDSDFSCYSSSDDNFDENRTHDVTFSELDIEKWSVASSDCLTGLLKKDIEYTKNPLS